MPITVTIQTEADIATTWERLRDVARWPEWNPACAEVEMDEAALEEGTRVRMKLRHPRGRLFWTEPRITTVSPPEELSWMVRAFGVRAPLTIRLEELRSGGTAVTLMTHSTGCMGFAYRLVFPEKTQGLLWSGTLTALAQSLRRERIPTEAAASPSGTSRRPRTRGSQPASD